MVSNLLEQHFEVSLQKFLHDMRYKPSQADQDVWLRPATTEDGMNIMNIF